MANKIKKSGQKIIKKFSRVSSKARVEGKEHIRENVFQRFSHIHNIRLLIVEWSLLVVALVLLAIAQAIWLGETYRNDVFVDGGTFSEATIGQINSMNPLFASTNSEKVLSKLMFSTLTTVDYSGNVGMGLAKTLVPSESGRIWTMTLKDDIKWSDGESLTTEDVLFTIGLIQNSAVNTVYSANLAGVKVSENDKGEVVFTLPSAYADFAEALEIPIVPKHELEDTEPKALVEDEFSNAPVTSGAFMFNALQAAPNTEESVVYLTSNPNYYLGKSMLNSFAVHTYEDLDDVLKAINSGTVTATAELSNLDADEVTSTSFIKRNSSIDSGAFIFFNTNNNVLKNKAIRSAIRQGIDIAALREAAPETTPINYPLIDSQIKISNYPAIPGYDYDSAKAKIAEITGGAEITLNITTVKSGYLPAVAEVLRSELENLGIKSNVVTYDETQDFIANVISRRNYDILIYEIELGAEPDLLPYYHSSQASTSGLNLSNYRSSLVDDLLIGARETLDTTLRVKKYESILEYWVADVPAIGIYQANMTYIYNKNVRIYGNDVRLVTPIDRFSDITNFAAVKSTRYKTP